LMNCWKKCLVEGDAKLFDQTVREIFVNLYFSSMLLHYDKTCPDYEIFEAMVKFLLKNMINRVTNLFGEVWAVINGGVPSGAFNTSHMDSWIMALYFCLFLMYQLHTAPIEDQEELEIAIFDLIRIIVYGDDHLYNKGEGKSAVYFSGTAFAKFMLDHFDVQIRDLQDGISFASQVREGFIVVLGATFLKHQFVVNPDREKPGQPTFLPFRESREFIVRAVHGRETRYRDEIDVLLSIIGHAYGTYAANRDAYDRLHLIYSEIVTAMRHRLADVPEMMMKRMTNDDIKKLRQAGLTAEQMVSGFPSWDTLVEKNVVDPVYQNITGVPLDYDYDITGVDDIW